MTFIVKIQKLILENLVFWFNSLFYCVISSYHDKNDSSSVGLALSSLFFKINGKKISSGIPLHRLNSCQAPHMINFPHRCNVGAQSSLTLPARLLCVLCVTSRAGQRGCSGVTNVSRWVISGWLYNKQIEIKFWKWKPFKKSILLPVQPVKWPWRDSQLSFGYFARGYSKVIHLKPPLPSPSVIVKLSVVMLKIRTQFCHFCWNVRMHTEVKFLQYKTLSVSGLSNG